MRELATKWAWNRPGLRFEPRRAPGTEADVARLAEVWQALIDHDCLACDATGPDGTNGGGCSLWLELNDAVGDAIERVSQRQEAKVFRRLLYPRRRWGGLFGPGARRWA